jgi:adenylate kinase
VVQRADDREDVIVTRLATYRRQTAPLVEFYERRGLLSSVDAALDADAVEGELLKITSALDAKA